MKKRIYAYMIVLLVIVVACLDVYQWLGAKEETIVPSVIRYSENNKQAEILFNVEGVNEEAYELETIISDNDGTVVYDGSQDTSEDIAYEAIENGEYRFTVTYTENKGEEIEEKKTVLTASVTEIITSEETETTEEGNTEEISEDIEINDNEEIIENAESNEGEEDTTISTLSDSEVAETETSIKATTVRFDANNFPDEGFRDYLKLAYGFKDNEELTDEMLAKVTKVELYQQYVDFSNVTDITGIEYFPELTKLNVPYTKIVRIDVSSNAKLEQLWAYECTSLTSITGLEGKTTLKTLYAYKTSITELNVTDCKNLTYLYIYMDVRN